MIIRTSAMGDIVHGLPVLEALRARFSDARVGWVVEETFAPLLADHPGIDTLVRVKMRAWRRKAAEVSTWREVRHAWRLLRDFRADVALDLMGNHKSGAIARCSGARRIIGAVGSQRREPSSRWWINEPVEIETTAGRHAVDHGLALLRALGIEPGIDAGSIALGGHQILAQVPEEAQEFLAARRRPFVIIQAGAGWANKTYPPTWWGQVAKELERRTGIAVWVPVAPGEGHLAEAIVESSGGAARAIDAKPFPFLAALLRSSRLVLGGDTGPIHLAHALGAPVLCLIGPTDPLRNGPYAAPGQVLHKPLPCSNCYKRFSEPRACLLNISPSEVVERACELLGKEEIRGG